MDANLIFLAQTATPAQPPPAPGAGPAGAPHSDPLGSMMVPLLLFFVIFYFLLIRPQQKRQKEHEKMMAALKVGDRVVTSSGIHGVIGNLKERTVVIKVADNVRLEFDRSSVVTVVRGTDEEKGKS